MYYKVITAFLQYQFRIIVYSQIENRFIDNIRIFIRQIISNCYAKNANLFSVGKLIRCLIADQPSPTCNLL